MAKTKWLLPVRQRKDAGTWFIDARKIGLSQKYVPEGMQFWTEEEAGETANHLWSDHKRGLVVKADPVTIGQEAADDFLAFVKGRAEVGEIQSTTHAETAHNLAIGLAIKIDGKPIAKHDLGKLINRVTFERVRLAILRAVQTEGKSASTQQHRVKALKQFFNYCWGKGWVTLNPMDKMELTGTSARQNRAPRIQTETIRRLMRDGLVGETLVSRAMVAVALATGMRQGELRGLQWQDIDFDAEEVRIERAVKKDGKIGPPKTKAGFRTIDIEPNALQLVREWRLQSRHSRPTDFVFATAAGFPKQYKTLSALMDRASDRAGIERMLWGDMRHFFASTQLSKLGEDWPEVSRQMGHEDEAFTMRQYGHYVKNAEKKAKVKNNMAEAIWGK